MPRAWFSRIEAYLIKEEFVSSSSEQTLFIKQQEDKILILSIYVDDILFTDNDKELLNEFKRSMKNEFEMIDLGKMRYFLGIEMIQKADGIFICQRKYAADIVHDTGLSNASSAATPLPPGCSISVPEDSSSLLGD